MRCRLCDSNRLLSVLDLGATPPCETFLTADELDLPEPTFPLHLRLCEDCLLLQIPALITPEATFTEYAYFSSYSDSWVQHVWLTMTIGIAVLMVRGRRLRRRAVALVVGAVLLTVAAYVALGGSNSEEPVARSAVGTGTLDWRIQGWTELLEGLSKGPTQWLIGEPLGGFARDVQGSEVEAEPHNFYVTTVLRTGVLGLLALIALTGGLLRALWRTPPGTGHGLLAAGVFPALLAMQIVWFLTWIPGMEQGIVTGLAVGLAAARGRGRPPFPRDGRRLPARTVHWREVGVD